LKVRLQEKGLKLGMPAHFRIYKESSEFEVWMLKDTAWVLVQTMPICKWSGQLGPKLKEGDGQSPEGFYEVTTKALNPNSNYHLSFNLAFPNAYDVSHGRTGSFLMVHGSCVSVGCYAMRNEGIEEIYAVTEAALNAGQASVPVHVFPFRMTDANMARHEASPHVDFWKNLKKGWDMFEQTKTPPAVMACGGRYVFGDAKSEAACQPIAGM
jgi:murein L,D-transpeptidase YafK